MPTRKIILKAQAGVRLERIETLSRQGRAIQEVFKVSTLRERQPQVLADERAAEDAFDLEVVASLLDPTAQELVKRGWRQ